MSEYYFRKHKKQNNKNRSQSNKIWKYEKQDIYIYIKLRGPWSSSYLSLSFLPLFLFIILPSHSEVLKFYPHWNHGKISFFFVFFCLYNPTGNIFSTQISSYTLSCYLKSCPSGLKKDSCHLYGMLKIAHGMWLSGQILLSLSDKDMV